MTGSMTPSGSADATTKVLSDPSPRERADAAGELGRRRDAQAVDALRQALGDGDASVREAVGYALRDAGDAGRVADPDLRRALQRESDPAAAVAMGWTLKRWDVDLHDVVEPLRKVTEQKNDPRARYHAALIIEDVASADVIAPVFVDTLGTAVAKDSRNKPEDRIIALLPGATDVILPLLASAATNSNPEARAAVARLLFKFKPRIDPLEVSRRLMANPSADVHYTQLPAAAESMMMALLDDSDGSVREAAAWSAGMCEPAPYATAPKLLKLTSDPVPDVRSASASSLARLIPLKKAPDGSLDAIAALLADPVPSVRSDAAQSLAGIGALPPDITRQLCQRVDRASEPDADVRASAANALGWGASIPELGAALLKGMSDPDTTVVERSLSATGMRGTADSETLRVIADLTGAGRDKGVRLTALGALRDLGPKANTVRAAVQAAAADSDSDIRDGASAALSRIDD